MNTKTYVRREEERLRNRARTHASYATEQLRMLDRSLKMDFRDVASSTIEHSHESWLCDVSLAQTASE